ncbi:MAG: DUF4258 domain-containing protein [Chitinivibrionales bacterium]|nr:DUF4258 domain-containing protein [Chitinivibrionales bacterium]
MEMFISFKNYSGYDLASWEIVFRVHATQRMFQRTISQNDVENILKSGKVIENYPNDTPLPSVLINGMTQSERPLHLVAAMDTVLKKLYIITVYEPDPQKWANSYSERIQK